MKGHCFYEFFITSQLPLSLLMNLVDREIPLRKQLVYSFLLLLAVVAGCYLITDWVGYRAIALILLLLVSIQAILFRIEVIVTMAFCSALIWNFFFIPPRFTFSIRTTEDGLLFLMYFVIALLHGVFSHHLRKAEKKIQAEAENQKTIALYNTVLNSLSHELRTPVSTIIGNSELLRERYQTLQDEQRRILLEDLQHAGYRLHRQLENLLNMSRIESGVLRPKFDWVDITELFHQLLDELEPILRNKVELRLSDSSIIVNTDHGLLTEILRNLIHNADQHALGCTKIVISGVLTENRLDISVEDDGVGVSHLDLPHLFDKFYRGNQRQIGGIGLGLSIVKGFTEALHGEIQVYAAVPHGVGFQVKIPIQLFNAHGNSLG